jgi:hypothetical protein
MLRSVEQCNQIDDLAQPQKNLKCITKHNNRNCTVVGYTVSAREQLQTNTERRISREKVGY